MSVTEGLRRMSKVQGVGVKVIKDNGLEYSEEENLVRCLFGVGEKS